MEKEMFFLDEWLSNPLYGCVNDLRWEVAQKIINHCALISATEEGEDSAGRQALRLLSPREVSDRALDIADEMVTEAAKRGWLRRPSITHEERFQYAGLIEKLKIYGGFSEGDKNLAETLKKIAMLTDKEPV